MCSFTMHVCGNISITITMHTQKHLKLNIVNKNRTCFIKNGSKCIRIVQTYQDPNHRSWLYHMRVRSELHFVLGRSTQ